MLYIYITLLKFNKTHVFYLSFFLMVSSSLWKAKVINSSYFSIIISFLLIHKNLPLLESPSLSSILLFPCFGTFIPKISSYLFAYST